MFLTFPNPHHRPTSTCPPTWRPPTTTAPSPDNATRSAPSPRTATACSRSSEWRMLKLVGVCTCMHRVGWNRPGLPRAVRDLGLAGFARLRGLSRLDQQRFLGPRTPNQSTHRLTHHAPIPNTYKTHAQAPIRPPPQPAPQPKPQPPRALAPRGRLGRRAQVLRHLRGGGPLAGAVP